MSEPILKAEHLGITFGGLKAVSDFNMTINAGELVGLIGRTARQDHCVQPADRAFTSPRKVSSSSTANA